MNMTEVSGTLLHAGYAYDEGLALDLYGSIGDDGEHEVESIAVAGTKVEIGQLFSSRQLANMGYWIDLKDGNAINKEWAERFKHTACVAR